MKTAKRVGEHAPVVIATMGGQARVVTLALDALLARGETFGEVVVLHLDARVPRVGAALKRLTAEFAGGGYAGRPCRLRAVPLRRSGPLLEAVRDAREADLAWARLREVVLECKRAERAVHLCVAGGRRMVALLAMSVAMLYCGPQDRVWHLYTPDAVGARLTAEDGLHVTAEDGVRVVPVPFAALGAIFPGVAALGQVTPSQVLAMHSQWLDAGERARCRAVLARLTARQESTLRAFAGGATPAAVARQLGVALATVNAHKTAIFAECRNAWGYAEEVRLDYHFLREKFGAYWAGGADAG